MDKEKRKRLEAAGFRFGDAADFLGLTEEERMLVELRVQLAQAIRRRRERSSLSQKQVAARIKSSQPRVAQIESAAPGVSLDLMFRSLFALGGNMEDLPRSTPGVRGGGRSVAKVVSVISRPLSKPPRGPDEPPVPRRKRKKPGAPVGA